MSVTPANSVERHEWGQALDADWGGKWLADLQLARPNITTA
jgi:hypothetical protein